MKAYSTQNIRNVVLLGSSKSGKTTLSYSTLLYAEFMDTKFNIIDTPGSDDFVGGAVSAFKVCDTGILVMNAQQGVEVGTEIFARYAEQYNVPLIVAVNQLDGEKASWENVLETMKEAFGSKPAIVQFPANPGTGFDGFIDVLKMKYYHFKDDNGTREDLEIPAEYKDEADELRAALIEKAAEYDDTLMEKFFDTGELSEDEIRKGLGLGLRSGEVMPVFCLSAKKDIGVKRLMEFTIRTAPSPAERTARTVDGKEIECKQDAPTSLFESDGPLCR